MKAVTGVTIEGICACVPRRVLSNLSDPHVLDAERSVLVRTTGVVERRVAPAGVTAVDMCVSAASALMADLDIRPDSVDLTIVVSQSADYLLPASAFIVQDRLGISRRAMCMDLSMGCSGYVYGLSVAASMMAALELGTALVLAGDVSVAHCNPRDKSAYPLFGDAGTATVLKRGDYDATMRFNALSDGSLHDAIKISHGGARNPFCAESVVEVEVADGLWRSPLQLGLDGARVFNFATTQVPPLLKSLMHDAAISDVDVDYLVLHQANALINKTVRKKVGFPDDKVPASIDRYGNTSSASIALTIASELRHMLASDRVSLLLSGYGVGLSCANAYISQPAMKCLRLIEL